MAHNKNDFLTIFVVINKEPSIQSIWWDYMNAVLSTTLQMKQLEPQGGLVEHPSMT